MIDKSQMTEEEIKLNYITPAILEKWSKTSIRMEYYFTSGRITIVRSKSEVVIADHLLSNKINYDYEPEVTVGDKKFRPDFVAYDPDDDDIFWYWEHVGMPTDPGYMARWENKKAYYAEHGIIEGKNLIITCDGDDGSLDAQVIDKLIKKTFDLD